MQAKKSNTWIWYFVILFVLAVAASASLIIYNLSQQLTPEKLAAAQALWEQNGPRDYDITYVKQLSSRNNPESTRETFDVKVRNGMVIEVKLDGNPLEQRLYRPHSIPGLFEDIKRFLDMDAKPNQPRTFTIALFDERDGHLRRYIRRVGGSSERVEIVVSKFELVTKNAAP